MDLTNPEDYAEEQAREQLRAELVRGYLEREEATAAYNKARAAIRDEENKEALRAKAHVERLEALKRAATQAHRAVEHTADCERRLMAEFVPLDLRKARDIAHSRMVTLSRKLDSAEGNVRAFQKILDDRDPKETIGALRDVNGQVRRAPSKPGDPSAQGKVLMGKVRNAAHWAAKAERAAFIERMDAAVLAASECRGDAEAAQSLYHKAQSAVADAFQAALNGR
jgi:hypothetical protein